MLDHISIPVRVSEEICQELTKNVNLIDQQQMHSNCRDCLLNKSLKTNLTNLNRQSRKQTCGV
jgi:hypothetical protein